MTWGALQADIAGVHNIPHAVLTFSGTWEEPGQGYASDVVNGLAEFVDDGLCFEVPVDYPAAFGPIGGSLTGPSYQQSIGDALAWAHQWLQTNPTQTFALIGYSQGAEAASRLAIALMDPDSALAPYAANFIGGGTFGNPCRGQGFHAPSIADPGGRGISQINMAKLPTINGEVVWADYVHSPANGDAGLDMYASVPTNGVGQDMTLVYNSVTNIQFNDLGALASDIVNTLVKGAMALGVIPSGESTQQGLTDLFNGLITDFGDITAALNGDPSGVLHLFNQVTTDPGIIAGATNAVEAAIAGIQFLAAPGGPTAPHISYLGEIDGYSNLVADAVGFLQHIATLTPAHA